MKLHEILDNGQQYELMTKLLTSKGLEVAEMTIRNRPALSVRLHGRTGRVQLKGDEWYMDVIDGQGHKLDSATGDEAAVARYFQPWLKGKLKESEHQVPLVWLMTKKLKDAGKRVSVSAKFKDFGPRLVGEVMLVDVEKRVAKVFAFQQYYGVKFTDADDEHYTLIKDKHSDFYWLTDGVDKTLEEEVLPKEDRLELLRKLLSASGFYCKLEEFKRSSLQVFHIGDLIIDIAPHGEGWRVFSRTGPLAGSTNRRFSSEQAVIDYLNSLRP